MRAATLPRGERFLSFASYYDRAELADVLSPDLSRGLADYDPLARHRRYLRAPDLGDDLSRQLYVDMKTFLPCLNLTYTDKTGMASSVEVRVPLLDDELVELAARIPSGLKLHGLKRKYVFKRSQDDALPREIVWRKKAGFTAPVRSWLERDLAPLVDDLLSRETIARRGLFQPDAVERMAAQNTAGQADHSLRLYALLTLELWLREFVDRRWRFEDLATARYVGAVA
jgi:asparagine synthase (glutamine-hydrolysing)